MTTFGDLLDVASASVKLALEVIASTAPGNITSKGDRDVASEVDYEVERRLREFLAEETPHIGFLGEENGESNERDSFWVLDPVDGTANFLHGLPMFGVSLALVEDGRPTLGLVSLPTLDMHYSATETGGAYCNGTRITASSTTSIAGAIVSLGDYAVGVDAADKNAERIAITSRLAERAERVRMVGSAATDLAWVAHGKLDATVILANKPWDTAAGTVLVREAGALVVDRFGEPHTLRSTSTIALSPALYAELVPLLGR